MGKSGSVALALILLWAGALFCFSPVEGTRPAGMAGVFVATSDDANAVFTNPAGLEGLNRDIFTLSYFDYCAGLKNDNLQEFLFSFYHRTERFGAFGFGATQFLSNVYRENLFSLVYSKRLVSFRRRRGFVALGISANLLRTDYVTGNFFEFDFGDPLFRNGSSSLSFGADLGFILRYRWLSLGGAVKNIIPPNPTLGNVPSATLPMDIRGGIALNLFDLFFPGFEGEYIIDSYRDTTEFNWYVGGELWLFRRRLGLRGGYNKNLFSAGLSLRTGTRYNIGFDYAYEKPLTEVDILKINTHRFALSFGLPKRPIRYVDLLLEKESLRLNPSVIEFSDSAQLIARVKNEGDKPSGGFHFTVWAEDSTGAVKPIFTKKLRSLSPGEETNISWVWKPEEKGFFKLHYAADANPDQFRSEYGGIDELDESNNRATQTVAVFSPPKPKQPVFSRSGLTVSQAIYLTEDTPIVPIVFFDEGTDAVSERFSPTLNEIAKRIKDNENVLLKLYGFFDVGTDATAFDSISGRVDTMLSVGESLAVARAKNVKALLVENGAPAYRIQVVTEGYEKRIRRAGQTGEYFFPQDSIWVAEENRRVEMKTEVIGVDNPILVLDYDVGVVKLSDEMERSFVDKVNSVLPILADNPDMILLFEGYIGDEETLFDLAFDRAFEAKWALEGRIDPAYYERIFVIGNVDEKRDKGKLEVWLDAEGLLERPVSHLVITGGFELRHEDMNFIEVDTVVSDQPIDSFSLVVKDDSGRPFRHLASGKGSLPKEVVWDWRDDEGNIVQPNKSYYCELFVRDKIGLIARVSSLPINIRAESEEKREEMVLVKFKFAEAKVESRYLESRMEYSARKLVKLVEENPDKRIVVIVGGHTDRIGLEAVNAKLSLERAKRELANLRKYLLGVVGLNTYPELDRWLAEHNVRLKAKGYGYTSPFKVVKVKDGKSEEILLGDNNLPEGRVLNRRVTVEFKIR